MTSLTERKADTYVARLFSGELTDKEAAEIEAWKNASEENRSAFESSITAWSDVELLSDDAELRALCDERTAIPLRDRPGMVWPLVAGVAIAALVTLQFWPTTTTDGEVSRFVTAIGERRDVTLADGTTISLNTNSDLFVSLSDERREVILSHGEAYFDVAPDPDRPFSVEAGTHTVTVLGTEFNVYRKNRRETTIAVFEGQVGLHRSEDQMSTDALRNYVSTPDQVVLGAGEAAGVDPAGNVFMLPAITNKSLLGAWRTGRLSFKDETLRTIVDELNRYSEQPIIITDAESMRLRVSAVIDLQQIGPMLDSLEIALPIEVTRQADRVLISVRAEP